MSDPGTNHAQRDLVDLMQEMKSRGQAFVVATVVKTVSVTAAKPGAKAIVNENGEIVDGWIGGGCAKSAVLKAASQAIADGQSRLVSLQPEELMDEQNSDATPDPQHIKAMNMCPSKGSMEIFVEPVLANPVLLVLGSSPVAKALSALAINFDFDVMVHDTGGSNSANSSLLDEREQQEAVKNNHPHRYIVIATQGAGDMRALELALSLQAKFIAFVGSSRKIQYLSNKLQEQGHDKHQLQAIQCPAGMDIQAVTPQEIALSILADVVRRRRA